MRMTLEKIASGSFKFSSDVYPTEWLEFMAQEILNLKARVEYLENQPQPDWVEQYDIQLA